MPLMLLVLCLSACNLPLQAKLPVNQDEESTPTIAERAASPTATEVIRSPTETPVPSKTSSPTATPDLSPASMQSIMGDLICRFGPGIRYGIGGSLRDGLSVLISARSGPGDWLQFELPNYPGKYCWVAAQDVATTGDLTRLSIAEAPLSFVTNVSVILDPPVIEPATCVFPLTFNVTFSIETIGPTFVTFQRSKSDGESAPPERVEFSEAGPMVFEDSLKADSAGEHWFQVSVISPNSMVGQGTGQVICP
jgi:hypothetical protein